MKVKFIMIQHAESFLKDVSLPIGKDSSHIAEEAACLQRQPGSAECFKRDLGPDWLHGSSQRSWH